MLLGNMVKEKKLTVLDIMLTLMSMLLKNINDIVSIEIQSIWITEDKLLRGCKWLNVIGKSV